LIEKFKTDTLEALEIRISVNPVLNSFQHVVHQYNISYDLIETFLHSMQMDLENIAYTTEEYDQYIFGSAEVVGLMCLYVFTEGNVEMYEELKPFAMKLGAAFQKVNFLRDIKDDHCRLGRTYFPNVDVTEFTEQSKKRIEEEIARDFKIALIGIKKLPSSSRRGVYLAYLNYRSLFKKIKRLTAGQILKERVRINNGKKLRLMLGTLVQPEISWS